MIDWALVGAVALGIVVGAVALVVLWVIVSLVAAGLYTAWYFVFCEWPDTWRARVQRREAERDGDLEALESIAPTRTDTGNG